MDSRLFSEIREKRNLCYTIYSTFDRTIERGAIKVYTATPPDKAAEAAEEILNVLRDLRENGPSDKEIESAKQYLNGMYKIGMQDYAAQAGVYASYEMWGRGYREADGFMEKIYAVTKEDIMLAMKKYFDVDRYCLVSAGPEK